MGKMQRFVLAAGLAMAALSTGSPAAAVRFPTAPWCLVVTFGHDEQEWHCQYRSIEECRPNLIGGNRGVCLPNPHAADEPAPVRRHKIRHKHRVNGD
jgi:hypothetical protein